MHVLIITDLEGVNGVLNFPDWCTPAGFRNETGCRFLTEEVNAAVAGFFAAGATQVTVVDAHGSGGSIRDEILDSRAALQRGSGQDEDKACQGLPRQVGSAPQCSGSQAAPPLTRSIAPGGINISTRFLK